VSSVNKLKAEGGGLQTAPVGETPQGSNCFWAKVAEMKIRENNLLCLNV
jgi:hypothetical protein